MISVWPVLPWSEKGHGFHLQHSFESLIQPEGYKEWEGEIKARSEWVIPSLYQSLFMWIRSKGRFKLQLCRPPHWHVDMHFLSQIIHSSAFELQLSMRRTNCSLRVCVCVCSAAARRLTDQLCSKTCCAPYLDSTAGVPLWKINNILLNMHCIASSLRLL